MESPNSKTSKKFGEPWEPKRPNHQIKPPKFKNHMETWSLQVISLNCPKILSQNKYFLHRSKDWYKVVGRVVTWLGFLGMGDGSVRFFLSKKRLNFDIFFSYWFLCEVQRQFNSVVFFFRMVLDGHVKTLWFTMGPFLLDMCFYSFNTYVIYIFTSTDKLLPGVPVPIARGVSPFFWD